MKRPREERDGKKEWVDPSKAADPEEPEEFDKDSFQTMTETGFEMPEEEESSVVTLDPCEQCLGREVVT